MKVLFLTREYPPHIIGGVGNHTYWLVKNLSKIGVKCKVLSFGNPSNSSTDVLFIKPESSVSNTKNSLKDNINIIYDIKKINRIANDFLSTGVFDILHLEDPYFGPFLKSWNTVTTVHDTSYGELQFMIHNIKNFLDFKYFIYYVLLGPILEFLTFRKTKKIIAISEQIKRELTRYYRLSENNIKIIPNGIFIPDIISKTVSKRKLGLPQDKLIIISSCRFVPRKRLDLLIKAVNILVKKDINNFLVLICGDGPQKSFIINLIRQYDLEDKIKLLGWMSREPLKSYYEAADIFTLTSEYEGCSTSLLESLSYGIASICSDIPGIIVTDSVNGIKFKSRDYKDLAEKLKLLIQDSELRSSVSDAGQELVKQFEWKQISLKTKTIYDRLLSDREGLA